MTTAAGVPFPSFPFAPSLVGAVPVGAVSAFAGPIHAPEGGQDSSIAESAGAATSPLEAMGWMVCDGRTLACTNYPELFSVLGYLYGGKDGCFNIPDYRGFLPPLPVGTSVAPAGELAADALPH